MVEGRPPGPPPCGPPRPPWAWAVCSPFDPPHPVITSADTIVKAAATDLARRHSGLALDMIEVTIKCRALRQPHLVRAVLEGV